MDLPSDEFRSKRLFGAPTVVGGADRPKICFIEAPTPGVRHLLVVNLKARPLRAPGPSRTSILALISGRGENLFSDRRRNIPGSFSLVRPRILI